MKSGFLLDVIVAQGTSVFQLLSSKDETLLIRRNSFLILNLSLDIINGIRWFNIQSDGLSSECLHKDLHSSTKTEDQMKSGFLLDVIVAQGTSVFQLLSSKDETLLIRRNSFLILNLGLDIINGIRWLNIQSDGLSSKCFDKDLHSSSETEDQMKSGFLLDVVVAQGPM